MRRDGRGDVLRRADRHGVASARIPAVSLTGAQAGARVVGPHLNGVIDRLDPRRLWETLVHGTVPTVVPAKAIRAVSTARCRSEVNTAAMPSLRRRRPNSQPGEHSRSQH